MGYNAENTFYNIMSVSFQGICCMYYLKKQVEKRGAVIMSRQPIQANEDAQANDLKGPQLVARIPLWVSIVVIIGALLSLRWRRD